MSEHYYTNQPSSPHDEKTWTFTLRGESFSFTTDRGVFSKGEVDFGSRLLIETFAFPELDGDILDVGCGYGPIGLALAKADPSRRVVMVDVNERACQLAEKNAKENGVKNADVRFNERGLAGFEQVARYAAVVTNPPIRAGKNVVYDIYEQAYERLIPEGELWVVIQKKQGAPSTKQKLAELFGAENVEVKGKKKGYYVFLAKKN
ncbi:class I SAM-dependent methyltransferase [Shouchella tritolerans]|uniref:class I SAM-dependent methyltransferase n=1 Tax=Shouchella tritolerans TaxID=2979466 RepID=UPI0007882C36|nr:class I SAM-dependent methyltransferase [Shouchella tritolerans]